MFISPLYKLNQVTFFFALSKVKHEITSKGILRDLKSKCMCTFSYTNNLYIVYTCRVRGRTTGVKEKSQCAH